MRYQLYRKLHGRLTALFTLVVLLTAAVNATTHAQALYLLTGTDDAAIVLDGTEKAPDLSSRMIYTVSSASGFDVAAATTRQVTILHNGQEIQVRPTRKETYSHLLYRVGITLSPLEMVAIDLSGEEAVITVAEDITYYDKVDEPAPFETVRVANPDMKEGEEKVVQEGVDGVRTSIYEVTWANCQLSSRQFVEELDSTAVDEIIEYGTAVEKPVETQAASGGESFASRSGIAQVNKNADGSGTLVLNSGETLAFSSARTMTATAYTAGHGGADYTTATGTFVQVGTVAVDRNIIPLGTRMYIVTSDGIVYGTAVAEDTGVRGNHVDLYYNTYRECIEFGRRSCTVYILK